MALNHFWIKGFNMVPIRFSLVPWFGRPSATNKRWVPALHKLIMSCSIIGLNWSRNRTSLQQYTNIMATCHVPIYFEKNLTSWLEKRANKWINDSPLATKSKLMQEELKCETKWMQNGMWELKAHSSSELASRSLPHQSISIHTWYLMTSKPIRQHTEQWCIP